MPKKNPIRKEYLEVTYKKGVIFSDSKSKAPLKLGSSEFIHKNHGNEKGYGIFIVKDPSNQGELGDKNY